MKRKSIKYADLEWNVFNNGAINDGVVYGSITVSDKVSIGMLPLNACNDIVAAHNASLGTLYARALTKVAAARSAPMP